VGERSNLSVENPSTLTELCIPSPTPSTQRPALGVGRCLDGCPVQTRRVTQVQTITRHDLTALPSTNCTGSWLAGDNNDTKHDIHSPLLACVKQASAYQVLNRGSEQHQQPALHSEAPCDQDLGCQHIDLPQVFSSRCFYTSKKPHTSNHQTAMWTMSSATPGQPPTTTSPNMNISCGRLGRILLSSGLQTHLPCARSPPCVNLHNLQAVGICRHTMACM